MKQNPPYSGDHWIPGDFWRICDVCGLKYRQSDTRKRWDNVWVCHADWETRHPQELLRGRNEKISVHEPRPEPEEISIGPGDVTPDDL